MSEVANGSKPRKVLRVGIIGLGELAQVSHILVLNSLSNHFEITYICDVSQQAIDLCAKKVAGGLPKTTLSPEELIAAPETDVVVICNVNAFHPAQAILALQHNKYVFVEKPLALNYRDLDAIIAAEQTSEGRVFVGYQRRYAASFLDAVKEVQGIKKIDYIRVRDIIGQNRSFVDQSGTFPEKYTDYPKQATAEMRSIEEEMVKTALVGEFGVEATPESMTIFRLFTGLGVHDFSALREMIGLPSRVVGASLGLPIWNVLFQYEGFPVMYESGIIDVPRFDAHLEVYSREKIVRIDYDTPYVKGLPVTMTIRERIESAQGDGYQERMVRKTYEDPFTLEFLDFYSCATKKTSPKTSAVDAREDLDLIKMIMQNAYS
ncbi:oxidoreductase family protein [Colletotrichum orchidophilum]|uniref:Oxidoreductase family protein n=1 Tax=Colletotrichum orchidophilum TaxID=1209926 RepID=A0A1G4AMG5_9PEZI|nr:oxidoreductase family protein [Colletotrichum orchidophilum]OHE90364.1 oxidoreductase family protein [Colletotrichum orchidophilum]